MQQDDSLVRGYLGDGKLQVGCGGGVVVAIVAGLCRVRAAGRVIACVPRGSAGTGQLVTVGMARSDCSCSPPATRQRVRGGGAAGLSGGKPLGAYTRAPSPAGPTAVGETVILPHSPLPVNMER